MLYNVCMRTVFFLAVLILGAVAAESQPIVLRISTENTADHVQTRALERFARELHQRSNGTIHAVVHHSGSLSRDRDVAAALRRGTVDMAAPGTWHLSDIEPALAVFLLPHFFAREAPYVHRYSDGPLGDLISRRLEQSLPVVVPGRWYDLGPGHLFFRGSDITSHESLAGMRIRVAGGAGNELRVNALGARGMQISWADLPVHLRRGTVDGVLTTHETVRSGELWHFGITHALEDHQYFPQYIPLIRRSVWDRLTAEQQETVRRVWEESVDHQRIAAAAAQQEARGVLMAHGITIRSLNPGAAQATRARLLEVQQSLARTLGVSPEILELLYEAP